MMQVLELADKDFRAVITTVLKDTLKSQQRRGNYKKEPIGNLITKRYNY